MDDLDFSEVFEDESEYAISKPVRHSKLSNSESFKKPKSPSSYEPPSSSKPKEYDTSSSKAFPEKLPKRVALPSLKTTNGISFRDNDIS